MKTAFITATLVATSNAAAVTCDWKPDDAGTGWAAGLSCPVRMFNLFSQNPSQLIETKW